MVAMARAIAAAAAVIMHIGDALNLDCDMLRPGGAPFDLNGTLNGDELRTNIADWPGLSLPTEIQGGLHLSVENLVHHYEWNGPADRNRLNVQLVEYSDQHAAVLTVVQRYSDGRHSVDTLLGTGLCELRSGSSSPEDGQ